MFAALIAAAVILAAPTSQYANPWYVVVDTTVRGQSEDMHYTGQTFGTKAECETFAGSEAFAEALNDFLHYLRTQDPAATLEHLRCAQRTVEHPA